MLMAQVLLVGTGGGRLVMFTSFVLLMRLCVYVILVE